MPKNKKIKTFSHIIHHFSIFAIGTIIIMTLGFFTLTWFSNNTTTHSIVGLECIFNNCQKINAGIMSLIIVFLVVFQFFFYHKYRQHKHEHLN